MKRAGRIATTCALAYLGIAAGAVLVAGALVEEIARRCEGEEELNA